MVHNNKNANLQNEALNLKVVILSNNLQYY